MPCPARTRDPPDRRWPRAAGHRVIGPWLPPRPACDRRQRLGIEQLPPPASTARDARRADTGIPPCRRRAMARRAKLAPGEIGAAGGHNAAARPGALPPCGRPTTNSWRPYLNVPNAFPASIRPPNAGSSTPTAYIHLMTRDSPTDDISRSSAHRPLERSGSRSACGASPMSADARVSGVSGRSGASSASSPGAQSLFGARCAEVGRTGGSCAYNLTGRWRASRRLCGCRLMPKDPSRARS